MLAVSKGYYGARGPEIGSPSTKIALIRQQRQDIVRQFGEIERKSASTPGRRRGTKPLPRSALKKGSESF
jgi:hypothetical protein